MLGSGHRQDEDRRQAPAVERCRLGEQVLLGLALLHVGFERAQVHRTQERADGAGRTVDQLAALPELAPVDGAGRLRAYHGQGIEPRGDARHGRARGHPKEALGQVGEPHSRGISCRRGRSSSVRVTHYRQVLREGLRQSKLLSKRISKTRAHEQEAGVQSAQPKARIGCAPTARRASRAPRGGAPRRRTGARSPSRA